MSASEYTTVLVDVFFPVKVCGGASSWSVSFHERCSPIVGDASLVAGRTWVTGLSMLIVIRS